MKDTVIHYIILSTSCHFIADIRIRNYTVMMYYLVCNTSVLFTIMVIRTTVIS